MSLNDTLNPPGLSLVDLCVLDLFQRNRLERLAFSLEAIHRSIVASAETAFAEFDLPHTRYMYSPFLVDIDPPVQPEDCIAAVERLIEAGCLARNFEAVAERATTSLAAESQVIARGVARCGTDNGAVGSGCYHCRMGSGIPLWMRAVSIYAARIANTGRDKGATYKLSVLSYSNAKHEWRRRLPHACCAGGE